jgi:outer membrane protein OmpA-like peptidoglycan-associated protein
MTERNNSLSLNFEPISVLFNKRSIAFIGLWLCLSPLYLFPKNKAPINIAPMDQITMLFGEGAYEQADSLLSTLDEQQSSWEQWHTKIRFALQLKQHPDPFPPTVVQEVNTDEDTYWPSISPDNQLFAVTISHRSTEMEQGTQEDLQFYHRDPVGKWVVDSLLNQLLNTPANEGSASFSADGNYLFFVASDRNDGLGSCDIYYLIRHGNGWSFPIHPEAPLNTRFWESNPSLSSDGRTLYFCSNRPGGIGGMDIWTCRVKRQDDGTLFFYQAENPGKPINTPQDEISPFIHPDNKTLYFSSNGHLGLGKQDIFVARKDNNGKWQKPENMGYPINSYGDEEGFTTDARGETGYYSSNGLAPQKKKQQIYRVVLPVTDRPQVMKCKHGTIQSDNPSDASPSIVQVIHLNTNTSVFTTIADRNTGRFTICYPDTGNYALSIVKEGYLFHFESINDSSAMNNIQLAKIAVGEKVTLHNIYFDFNSAILQSTSEAELNQLCTLLNSYPMLHMLIAGHTDSTGSSSYNQGLSNQRAYAVVNYLVSHGIAADRLRAQGYGATQPIADNKTEQGRALNRRTEAIILSVK